MVIFDGFDLIILAIGAALLIICGVFLVVERISCAVKNRRQKRNNMNRRADNGE